MAKFIGPRKRRTVAAWCNPYAVAPSHIGPRKAAWREAFAKFLKRFKKTAPDSEECMQMFWEAHEHQIAGRAGDDCRTTWEDAVVRHVAPGAASSALRINDRYGDADTGVHLMLVAMPQEGRWKRNIAIHLDTDSAWHAIEADEDVTPYVVDHLRGEAAKLLAIADNIEAQAK